MKNEARGFVSEVWSNSRGCLVIIASFLVVFFAFAGCSYLTGGVSAKLEMENDSPKEVK